MALFYKYWFKSPSGNKDVVYYASELAEAEKQYFEVFGVAPKKLEKRERW